MFDLKKSSNLIDWERFSLYLRNKIFPQTYDLCRNTTNNKFKNINWPNYSLFKKTNFLCLIVLISGAKKVFPKNLAVSHTSWYRFLPPCQNLEKTNDPIQRKYPDRQQDKRMDRHYFIGPTWLLPGVQQAHWQ